MTVAAAVFVSLGVALACLGTVFVTQRIFQRWLK